MYMNVTLTLTLNIIVISCLQKIESPRAAVQEIFDEKGEVT
jgi:hypothetical protein